MEEEVNDKKSLKLYKKGKESIKGELIYDHTPPASVVLYQARTSSLPLEDRKHQESRTKECQLCHEENEDFEHFMLKCNKTEN